MNNPTYVLTIAGSDPSGGAGIQADLDIFRACQAEGLSVITAITAQTANKFNALFPVPRKIISLQLSTILDEYPVKAVKTGLLYSPQIIRLIFKQIKKRPQVKLIIDPIMKATLGAVLLKRTAIPSLKQLIKQSFVITPNLDEAGFLAGIDIDTLEKMKQAAAALRKLGCQNVIIKGGHLKGTPIDLLYDGKDFFFDEKKRIEGIRFHGLGCRYSAALTAFLGQGYSLREAFHKTGDLMSKILPSLILKSPSI